MKKIILFSIISLIILKSNAQLIKPLPFPLACNNAMPLQQIGGATVVMDPALVYQVCINKTASDKANPQLAKHLVGAVKVTNNSLSVYQVRVYYFWKGNQVNTELVNIKPKATKNYAFNLTAKPGKENLNTMVEVRSEKTRKL